VVRKKIDECRIVRIKNTLSLGEIDISENMISEIQDKPDLFEVISTPSEFLFDAQFKLSDF